MATNSHNLVRGTRVEYVGSDAEWQGARGFVARVYTYDDGVSAADVYWDVGYSHLVDTNALKRVEV